MIRETLVCDSCGRSANGDSPDSIYVNPYGCGHDLCDEHMSLRNRRATGCRICDKMSIKVTND
jgi:hypothetical protein